MRSWLNVTSLALAAMWPWPAAAQSCSVGATAVAFGTYSPFTGSVDDSTGSVTVTCGVNGVALLLNYSIALSSGGSGSFAGRTMSAAGHTLPYQLYRDALRSSVWGDGSGGSSVQTGGVLLSVAVPVSASYTVYGRIPASQTGTVPGSYSDVITVTITY